MKPTQGRRAWIKLWTSDWLEGTTRYQMSDAQRAFWIDLLAMAGRSRFGGIVCSGKDGKELIGYPLSKFQGLLAEPFDVEATLALFERTGKIKMQVSGEGNRKLYVLFILNWAHYQSEYDRTRKYRSGAATPNATDLLHPKSQACYGKSNRTEGEGEKEVVVVQENAAMYDQENHYISLSGAWKKLGLYRISDRYSDFRKLVKGMKLPDIKETKAAFCGRVLDECGKQGIDFPPEFLAITRRLRKDSPNAAFFTVAEQIVEENRRRGTP